jgi:hypothetical protein
MSKENKPDEPWLYPPKKELLKHALLWEYGSEHSLEEISEILGIEIGGSNYYNSIRWVDDELIPNGKKLENIRGEGYRVIKPDEHVRMSNTKVKKARKFATLGLMISQYARRDKMDAKAKAITDEHTMSLSRTVSMFSTESIPLVDLEQQMATRQLKSTKPKMFITEGESEKA